MAFRDVARDLVGEWSGRDELWLGPGEPVRESATEATVTTAAGGGFLLIAYTWSHGGEPHDGVLLARLTPGPGAVDMVWVDSFHTQGQFMTFAGQEADDGAMAAFTTWSPGSGPDWGWRIVLDSGGPDDLTMRMYIATPDGEEAPAVASRYARRRD